MPVVKQRQAERAGAWARLGFEWLHAMGLPWVRQDLRAAVRAEQLNAGRAQRRARVRIGQVQLDAVVVACVDEDPDVVVSRIVAQQRYQRVQPRPVTIIILGFMQEEPQRSPSRRRRRNLVWAMGNRVGRGDGLCAFAIEHRGSSATRGVCANSHAVAVPRWRFGCDARALAAVDVRFRSAL